MKSFPFLSKDYETPNPIPEEILNKDPSVHGNRYKKYVSRYSASDSNQDQSTSVPESK